MIMLVLIPLTVPFMEGFFRDFMEQEARTAELAADGYFYGIFYVYLEMISFTYFIFFISMKAAASALLINVI